MTNFLRVIPAIIFLTAAAQFQDMLIGSIDFYSLNGLDPSRLRAALSVRPGDRFEWPGTRDRILGELSKSAGRPVTHFSPICCDTAGRLMLYVGLGAESKRDSFRPKPEAGRRLAPELVKLYEDFMGTLAEALKFAAGRPDDYSQGYSLSAHPPMRAIQLRIRDAAVANGEAILAALSEAADDTQRIAAAHLAGYTRQSQRQVDALMDAARDPNSTVRNNATRALGVLAATPAFARQIPAAPFIDMLNSPVWSDRNKGLMLLASLTRERNPELLAKIRAKALPSLIEMAQWQNPGHSGGPILILGRIAGMDEAGLASLSKKGHAAPVLAAIGKVAR